MKASGLFEDDKLATAGERYQIIERLPAAIRSENRSRRRALLRWVEIALKPAAKTLGSHRIFTRGQGLKHLIADSTFERKQVDGTGAYRLDADEHHLGLALRTAGGAQVQRMEWPTTGVETGAWRFPRIGGSATLSVTDGYQG